MSWRVVVVSQRAKLDLKMNYLVIRGEDLIRIHLSEISLLIIENTAISLTASLLSELTKRKIKVIFCDEKRNPDSELIPYYGSHDTSAKLRTQIKWNPFTKDLVWTEIVKEKIRKQKELLQSVGRKEAEMLEEYISQVEYKDSTNREGHAAKVYFNSLFGLDFSRGADNEINAALNYGYSILLSVFNREIVSNGYVTQLGICHDNMFNPFNLSSDLMEIFRPLVDKIVLNIEFQSFGRFEKLQLIDVLNQEVFIDGKRQYVNNAVKIFCRSVFDGLNEDDVSLIRFYRNEL